MALEIVSGAALPAPPYPEDTRAGNYLFSLDVHRVFKSDTWTLAPADVRPWLLMLWMMSWDRIPCASYTDDDELIAAAIGMSLGQFQTHRKLLMRGWRKFSDGRLYHDYLTSRVHEMLEGRAQFAARQRRHRATKPIDSNNVTRMSRVTNGVSRADVDVDVDFNVKEKIKSVVVADAPTAPPEKRLAKRATRLSGDWFLPDEWRDWAVRVHGIDAQKAVRISLDFRDYWHAKAGPQACKLDWQATWRRWVRKECGDA